MLVFTSPLSRAEYVAQLKDRNARDLAAGSPDTSCQRASTEANRAVWLDILSISLTCSDITSAPHCWPFSGMPPMVTESAAKKDATQSRSSFALARPAGSS